MKKELLNDFIRYVKIDTQSDSLSKTIPSTEKQKDLGNLLCSELKELGLNPEMDQNGFVYVTIASNTEKKCPKVGFLAHLDTAPDYPGANVKPQVIENYQGQDIEFFDGTKMTPKEFPELNNYLNQTIITSDGSTLLGADDKAGIAIIMQLIKFYVNNKQVEHGEIQVCFSIDEEIGTGVQNIDVNKFTPDFAYTVDGEGLGTLNYETFNAAALTLHIEGRNVHPGYALNKMVNAIDIAFTFQSMMPRNDQPEFTKDYEGFYMLHNMQATIEHTTLNYIIRDHNSNTFADRKNYMIRSIERLKEIYPQAIITFDLHDQYYNMKDMIEPVYHIFEYAIDAIKQVGLTPNIVPIRGGTDGSKLSYMNIPCPNIFSGSHNVHGKYEFACLEAMESCVDVLKIIVDKVLTDEK